MARSFNGSTDRIDYGNPGNLANSALTMAAWVYPTTLNITWDLILSMQNAANSEAAIVMSTDGSVNTGSLELLREFATSYKYRARYGSGELTTGSWQHVCVTSDSGASAANMECYVDGAVPGSTTTDESGSSGQTAASGTTCLGGGTWTDAYCFGGRIAEAALWNRVLSADEIAALAKAFSPLFFRNGLKFYVPCVRAAIDVVAGKTPTYDGTSVVSHPRILYPR